MAIARMCQSGRTGRGKVVKEESRPWEDPPFVYVEHHRRVSAGICISGAVKQIVTASQIGVEKWTDSSWAVAIRMDRQKS